MKKIATQYFATFIISATIALLAACQSVPAPQTPRQALLAAYSSTQTAANAIEIAKRDGIIDSAKRDDLIIEIKKVSALLEQTRVLLTTDPVPNSPNGLTVDSNLRAIQNILLIIQSAVGAKP